MHTRRLPVRPDFEQLRHQAKDLLRAAHTGDPGALAELQAAQVATTHPENIKLSEAQYALARSYQAESWARLKQACQLVDAIWSNDITGVRALITQTPALLREPVLIRRDSNWGAPLSYAANLGANDMIRMLHGLGATDLEHAMDRAALQGKVDTVHLLYEMMGSPAVPVGALAGPAYTLSVGGTATVLQLGAKVYSDNGKRLAPVDVVLETDSRKPLAKHQILELYVRHGLELPDTPTMALHRGRIDLLELHLQRDPQLLNRTFSHEEIYPPSLGCHDEVQATQGTPLKGTTLLHLCVDYDEYEIAEWLISRGADVNTRAAVDVDGFGGHTALFGTVVSQPAFWMNYGGTGASARFTALLLKYGADVTVRASLRKQLHPGYGDHPLREYRDVTAVTWGERFEEKVFVNQVALDLIREMSAG